MPKINRFILKRAKTDKWVKIFLKNAYKVEGRTITEVTFNAKEAKIFLLREKIIKYIEEYKLKNWEVANYSEFDSNI